MHLHLITKVQPFVGWVAYVWALCPDSATNEPYMTIIVRLIGEGLEVSNFSLSRSRHKFMVLRLILNTGLDQLFFKPSNSMA
ncbi:MAG: hypothetical protein PUP93_08515 [Rhizonema sp. NSF051]|nr:hypothetical protein [Rhizonema sp. NSF051]